LRKITVVIPTYNEAENISKLIPMLFDLPLETLNVLIVDDNSADGTGEIADELSRKWKGRLSVMHRAGKQGLGTAYIQGFGKAIAEGADAVGEMDADFSHPPEKLVEMFKALEGHDAVIGSRYVAGGSLDENWPLWRKGLSSFGNWYARTILGLKVRDVTGGFRLYRKDTIQNMPLERIRSNGYVFQVEMTYVATRLGYRFKEIPIHFADRRWGDSKMSFRIQIEAALRVWKLRWLYRDLIRIKGLQSKSA
jgi:dolichol-phosphate mannosyltransferase